jgi:hypothetical protein
MSREIQKLEARLESLIKSEESFVDELRRCVETFRDLNVKTSRTPFHPDIHKEWMKLRLEAIRALSEALKKAGKAEHARSHLLESYSALILALEFELSRQKSPS